MLYEVVITARVRARNEEEAEREAIKAIVADLSGWQNGAVRFECRPVTEEADDQPASPDE